MSVIVFDESGDPGMRKIKPEHIDRSSLFFTVAAVFFKDPAQASACDARINALRIELGIKAREEFHFTSASKRQRSDFLQAVSAFDLRYAVTTLDKLKLQGKAWHQKDYLVQYAARKTLDVFKTELVDSRLFIDKSSSKQFNKEMCKHLKHHAGSDEKGVPRVKDAQPYDSAKHNLVQLVDMVCGAVLRSFDESKNDGEVYRGLIRKREALVQLWP